MKSRIIDGREIASVNAKSKAEAIVALKALLDKVENTYYDDQVVERVLVTNEGECV